jgi:ABC-2 type transport system ATP-binding protein
MTAAIDVKGLNKSFGDKHVVRDVSIRVEEGRITGFLGPNGAGKTTTLRLLCGLLTPDSGEGQVLGLDFRTQTDAIKRETGYMTQRFSLYEDMTIEENLDFIARVYELPDRRGKVTGALERLGLQDRRTQLAGALSGGWKQRLALAAATLHEPRLLLLDEPTAGVDPKARREFWDEIHALADDGLTVLVSTHYMDEAERCHDIGYILYGRLIARGTAEEIVANSGLVTFNGEGPDIGRIAQELEEREGVLSASAFGTAVHVSGTDRDALERAIAAYDRETFQWEEVTPSLEDVFIQLMGRTPDDRYAS